jgi:hypothetical protein
MEPLQAGIYQYKGKLYLLICEARDHHTDEEKVVYVPLYDKPEWTGTVPASIRSAQEFREKFTFAGRTRPFMGPER